MKAGLLDRVIQIQQKTPTQSASGEESPGWTTIFTTWARVAPMGRKERFEALAKHGGSMNTFQIRWRTGVDTTMQILYGGEAWRIIDITEMGRHEGLEITAEIVR